MKYRSNHDNDKDIGHAMDELDMVVCFMFKLAQPTI